MPEVPSAVPGKRHQESHSRAQREEFLRALDRLGTVTAAAQELGINRSTCQKWANAAGIRRKRRFAQEDRNRFHLVVDRTGNIAQAAREFDLKITTGHSWAGHAKPGVPAAKAKTAASNVTVRRHPLEVKARFLEMLQERGNLSPVAEELGLNRSTCSNWAQDAGIAASGTRHASAKRAEYLRLRREGTGRKDAQRAVGASKPSSYAWDRQQSAQEQGTGCPGAEELAYKQFVTTTFAESPTLDTTPETPVQTATSAVVRLQLVAPRPVSIEDLEQFIDARLPLP